MAIATADGMTTTTTLREYLTDLMTRRQVEPIRLSMAVRWCETWIEANLWDRAVRDASADSQAHMAVGVYGRTFPGSICVGLFDQPAWKQAAP